MLPGLDDRPVVDDVVDVFGDPLLLLLLFLWRGKKKEKGRPASK